MNKKRILVPVDLENQSDSALNLARSIAKRLNVIVSCLYVIDEHAIPAKAKQESEGSVRQRQRRAAEYRLSERVNSILNEAKTPFELIISPGKVPEKILDKSRDFDAQLIIMSRSSSGGKRNKRIGSTTKHIIEKSQVPVITIGNYKMENRENIIVPLDVLKPIVNQVSSAIDTAVLLGASVSLISVMEPKMQGHQTYCLKRLKDIRMMFKDLHIDCNSHLLPARSSVPEEIISFSGKLDSAIILLMKGRKMNDIISKSELPVQCIHPDFKPGNLFDDTRNFYKPSSLSWSLSTDHFFNSREQLEA